MLVPFPLSLPSSGSSQILCTLVLSASVFILKLQFTHSLKSLKPSQMYVLLVRQEGILKAQGKVSNLPGCSQLYKVLET